ncbi:unnamed protein product [Fraxinus pennsylvanica]|uniref:Uncharacterized protein n=1 Tax=Fraxinus pennsylvanica TaxID=56036 RepID=A0AAD2ADA8_9LAMI|nr:unnamed protein product [Fraxinus pennsylvanica]
MTLASFSLGSCSKVHGRVLITPAHHRACSDDEDGSNDNDSQDGNSRGDISIEMRVDAPDSSLNQENMMIDEPSPHEVAEVEAGWTVVSSKQNKERGNGGGLALSAKDRPCPFIVMQENYEASSGHPLKLFPLDNKQQVVNLSTYLNIVFSAATICVQSTVWKLGSVDEITGRRYVSSGGVMGRPGVHSVDTWFKIEKYGNGYKIVWCPASACNTCKVVCGNVGVFVENDKRWLGLSDVPLVVVFKRSSN